jgi:leucyl aminopeptidase
VVQFDMTNYNGSANDVSFITDFTDGTLNSFLMQLVDHYNASGTHAISYGTSLCNYGCSDHASWNNEGYMAAFPFEANFGQHNSNIHSANDTFNISGTAAHAAKFSKLCAEFLIETAKSSILSVDQSLANSIFVMVNNGEMVYNFEGSSKDFNTIAFYNLQGRKVHETNVSSNHGSVQLTSFSSGIYIASFIGDDKSSVSKKVIVE